MSKPALSETAERLYNQMAPTFGRNDEANGWAYAYHVQGLCKMIDPAAEIVQPSGGKPSFAILFEPQRCPEKWLPWVGQFVGVPPSVIEGLLKQGKVSEARAFIEHPLNLERGTTKAMELVARATLTESKTLFFYTNFGGEAFVIKAASLTSQTPHPQETREAIESMMAAWGVLQYETVSAGTLAILEASHPKLSEVEAAHTTLSDLELHPEK